MIQRLSFFLKLALLCTIFYWILRSVNIKDTINVLEKTNIVYFFIAFLLSNISNIFLTIKWKRLASPLKIKSNFLELLKLNYISIFYSSFLPGQSTGELVKGIRLAKKEGSFQNAWIPIFIDKVTNLLIIFIIGFIAVITDEGFRDNSTLITSVSLLTLSLLLITLILFSEKTGQLTNYLKDNLAKVLKYFKIKIEFIENLNLNYLEYYRHHKHILLETLFWSLLTKLPHVFAFLILALSLNIHLNIMQCTWLFSIVSLVTFLPISFSGLGIRESTIIVTLAQVGVERSSALSLSLLIFAVGILIALLGGLVELFSGNERANEQTK